MLTAVPVAEAPLLLINPGVAVPTGPVFAAWDGLDRGPLTDWSTGRNDLELPAIAICPVIAPLIDWLRAQPGATLARMSGSGATSFALFGDDQDLATAAEAAARDWPGAWVLPTRLAC